MEPDNTILMGYHGCDEANVAGIIKNNFNRSQGQEHYAWLGEGAYFFGVGFTDPISNARQWAVAEAWDGASYRYLRYAVLKASIKPKNLLDITTDMGKRILHEARQLLVNSVPNTYKRQVYDDEKLLRHFATRRNIDVIVWDAYVKFTHERKGHIHSKFPNVRMICVYTPQTVVDKESIQTIDSGRIPNVTL
jgi:hypothetical protein